MTKIRCFLKSVCNRVLRDAFYKAVWDGNMQDKAFYHRICGGNKKNKVHCLFMASLGYLGKGDKEKSKGYAKKGLELDRCHTGFTDLIRRLG